MHTSYHSGLASTIVVHWRGLQSCEITPTAFVVWPPPCTRGNKAHDVSVGSLVVKTAGSIWERLAGRHVGDPLAHGEGPRLSTELPDRELGPYEGLQRGLGRSLRASRYLGKNTGVVDGSLHISTLLFSFRIYIVCITPFCGRDSNTLAKL